MAESGRAKDRVDLLAAGLIFLAVAGVVALTCRDAGLTWDEPIYEGFAAGYIEWYQTLPFHGNSAEAIERFWWAGQAHPPLGKIWIALCLVFFVKVVGLIAAARLGAGILFGVAAATLYVWVGKRHGRRTGVLAAAVFVLLPRLFAHGHFASLEMPMLLLWLGTTIAFERGIRDRRWGAVCGVLFGLALLTKINAVFLPLVLIPWGLVFYRRRALWNVVFMAVLGPLVFYVGWPAMWHDPFGRLVEYLGDKAHRMIIPVYYLGRAYRDSYAPWHYPFVMFLATTPLLVLVGAGAGVRAFGRRLRLAWREAGHEVLLLWSFVFPVLLLAVPGVPKYDGIRLMLPAYPFLAVLAAVGGIAIWDWVRGRLGEGRRVALAVLVMAWVAAPVVLFHPFQLCYYGELAGGPWGAQRLGLETTYWNDTLDGRALDYLNENVPANSRVAVLAVGHFVWGTYGALGELRGPYLDAEFSRGDWDFLVVVPRQGWLTEGERAFLAERKPVWVNGLAPFGSPPVCLIYRRE